MSARALMVLALVLVPVHALAQVEVVIVSHEGPSEHADRARLGAAAFARCREPGPADAPQLVVRLALAIARDGHVASLTLTPNTDTTPPDMESVRSCVLEHAAGLRFARGDVRRVELLIRARHPAGAVALDALEPAALAALAPPLPADAAPDYTEARVSSVSRAHVEAVEGTLTRAVLERVLARYTSRVRQCYQVALSARPALTGEGEIVVQFHRLAPPRRLPTCSGGGCGY